MQYTQYYIKMENETLLDTMNTIGIRDKGLLKINLMPVIKKFEFQSILKNKCTTQNWRTNETNYWSKSINNYMTKSMHHTDPVSDGNSVFIRNKCTQTWISMCLMS